MSIITMDLKTAKWIADKAQNDIAAFPVEMAECEKCGAVFIPALGHTCGDTIDLDFHEVNKDG